ncbi:DUF7282 domain-containing protein [Halococcus agarilyticus]|uniref:DUF7282 domain-containing protein n=1 Tax=Halococcus agarilyticus TaxID=1232219 RepID=UPI000678280C|nr:PGF-CTERM sorting domain-containing protein [Halococcus agarilyticus]
MRTRTLTVALLSALLIASAGTAGALTIGPLQPQESPTNTTTSSGSPVQGGPSVTFDDQASSGQTVLVASATVPEQSFVAVYDSSRSGNETDQIIGASYLLQPGTSDNIRIQLDEPLTESKSLTAVVHTDSNGNGEFDYVSSDGGEDAPLTPEGDRRIVDIAQISVENAGGANESTATDTTVATTDGATNATTAGEMTTGETTADETTAAEPTAEATAAEETTAEETAADETSAATEATSAGETNGSGDSGNSGAFGPGFGPVVAVVALLAAALLVARRRE